MRFTQRKCDTAVAQAVATFTKLGFDVSLPFTESAAYDLIIDIDGVLKKVQVKFCSKKEVGLRRIHSNSSGYIVKKPIENSFDWVYILNSDGVEYLIPYSLAGRNSVTPQQKDELGNVLKELKIV